jgi:hypothetical protein
MLLTGTEKLFSVMSCPSWSDKPFMQENRQASLAMLTTCNVKYDTIVIH